MLDVSIIIVNWNAQGLLARCLRCVQATVRRVRYELIVIDNASTDGSQAMLRLDDLAAQACLSPNQFLRVFRRAFDLSPMQHLIHLRVARACELLRGTDWSISEIAYSVGFHDSNYFTRQFRRITGQTPGAFRRGFSHWQGERDTNRGVG